MHSDALAGPNGDGGQHASNAGRASWGWNGGHGSGAVSDDSMGGDGFPGQLQPISTDDALASMDRHWSINSRGSGAPLNASDSLNLSLRGDSLRGDSFILRSNSRSSLSSVSDRRSSSKSIGSIEDNLSNDPEFVNWVDSWVPGSDDLEHSLGSGILSPPAVGAPRQPAPLDDHTGTAQAKVRTHTARNHLLSTQLI